MFAAEVNSGTADKKDRPIVCGGEWGAPYGGVVSAITSPGARRFTLADH